MHTLSLSAYFGFLGLIACGCGSSGSPTPGSGGSSSSVDVGGTSSLGGTTASGGVTNGGGALSTGGSAALADGGAATGGKPPSTGGSNVGANGGAATGGKPPSTGGSATTTGGQGNTNNTEGPCDILETASTPCVAAYATTRSLSKSYTGPLYQVRKGGSWDKTNGFTGGTTQDIVQIGGYPDTATQDSFCSGGSCTFSVLYDQSGKKNDLKVAPKGCYTGTASEPDYESSATKKSITINGHKAYALFTIAHDGYRNNTPTGVVKGTGGQGIYMIVDGSRDKVGAACCFDFGNAAPNNCNGGTMTALFFGTGYWGKGVAPGPWFLADFEGGVWAGGSGGSNVTNNNNPTMSMPFAVGWLKSGPNNYAIRAADGAPTATATVTTAYDGAQPKTLSNQGAIILGIGGDNSNSSTGTFYEGVMTSGRPTDDTDAKVLTNIRAANYGK